MKKIFVLIATALVFALLQGCSTAQLQKAVKYFGNLEKLEFKLSSVDNFKLVGIGVSKKSKLDDFSIMEGIKLKQSFDNKTLPADFTLNVAVKNPNDGDGKSNPLTATIKNINWRLFIDDVPTISGDLRQSFKIPGNNQETIIPLGVSLDLYEFFGQKSYTSIANLVMAIGGVGGKPSRLKLDIMPTISTPVGDIKYPNRITVVDHEYRGGK